ncbi:MAG: hypothetical protein KQH79_03700 [Bacteroidetes bacterium]|nr:hypothetical protein [Bacteroidota bacterium]
MKKYNKILRKIIPVFILASTISVNLNAQTGPGGVGNRDGSNAQPEVLFWLSADSLGLSNGSPVTLWNDISGNNRDFAQGTVGNQPAYVSSGINSIPTVSFDGTDDFLEDDDAENYINGLSGVSVIAVVQSNEIGSDAGFFDTEDPDGQDDLLAIRYDEDGASSTFGEDVIKIGLETSSGNIQMESSEFIQSTSPQMFTLQWNSGGTLNLYEDGTLDTPTYLGPTLNIGGTIQNTTKAIIGRGPKDAADGWNGYVSEVILVGENLSQARRNIIENYLSEKYNIAISNDLLTSLDAAYNNNIAGIGEEADGQHTTAASAGMYLTALSGLGVGDYVFASHNNLTNNIASFRTSSDAEIAAAGAIEAYNRTWYVEKVNTPTARIGFDFSEALEDGLFPTNYSNYVLLYRAGTSGNFSKVKNADGIENGDQVYFDLNDAQLQTGYYTLATEDDAISPLEGIPGRTWYTLIGGDWDNWEIWTLDPSGALPNNPNSYTPSTSPTNTADKVVIKTGRTVTVSSDSLDNASLVIEGRLDLQTTTGHNFGEIRGTGRVLLAADNFPDGDASHFYTKGQGEGTVEYYGGSYKLSTAREFYNVEIELDNPANIIKMAADYNINGNLYVTNGILQINDETNTTPLQIDVAGDVNVDKETALSTEGKITVGAVDAYDSGAQTGYGNYHKGFHVFRIGGNFTNNNSVRFTKQTNPDYDSRATNGAVSLVFYGAANKTFSCYGTTDLYNLVIDKGTDRTYELQIYADDKADFTLFGQNNLNWDVTDPANPEMRKALWIKNGTLTLKGSVYIPSLSEGTVDFTIGQNARLKLDGDNVFVGNTANEATTWTGYSHPGTPDGIDINGANQGLYVLGKLQVDNGHYYLGEAEAINFRDEASGIIEVNGGLLETNQIAISSSATLGNFSFLVNGGEVRITREYGGDDNRAMLNLDTEDMVFSMSGGELYIEDVTGHDPNCIHIASLEGNYNVTGGTVYIDVNDNATVRSTAPFYNLQINNGSTLTLQEDLTVLGDLTIENGATLTTAGFDVYVGGDFDLQNGGTYTHGGNTTHFIGNGRSNIYVRNTLNSGELLFNNVTLSKDQRYNTSLFHRVEVNSPGRNSDVHPVEIQGNLYIERGEFDVDEWEVDVHGNIEIVDGQIISSETVNPEGWIVLNGSVQQTIKGSDTKEQEFGSFELDNANGVLLLSDINVNDFILTPNGGNALIDLDIYNMDISGDVTLTTGAYGNSIMFQTAGNASDGGLGLAVSLEDRNYSNETVAEFPIGSSGVYNPAYVYIDGNPNATSGTLSINGVDGLHPAGTSGNALEYYWVTDADGFSGINSTAINYVFTYPAGFDNGWQCYYLEEGETDWIKDNSDASPNAYFYDVGMISGDFAVGNNSGFNNLTIFYSRQDGNWSNKNSWSKDSYGGAASNKTPEMYDIVKIGYSGSPGSYTRHRITLDVGTAAVPTEIAQLVLEQNPEAGAIETNMSRLIILPTTGLKINGTVSGDGEIQFQMDGANIPTLEGDFGDFVNTEGASFIMRSNNGNVMAPTNLTRFPRLSVPGSDVTYDDTRSVTFTTDIYCHNLNVRYGGTLLLNNGAKGDIEVRDSLRIGGIGTDNEGRIIYQNNGTARTIKVGGDLVFDTDGTTNDHNQLYVETGGTDNLEHYLQVYGDIILRNPNSYMDLWTANDGAQSNVILELLGEDNAEFSDVNNTGPELYRIVMNKGGSGSATFDFNDAFILNGPTDGNEKAIELISGRLGLHDSGIDETLTSGGADFKIPSGSELWLGNSSTVRVSGNNTGIWLDGTLTVGYGVEALFNEGTNNYIQYTSSGNSEIIINSGSNKFYVGSQIRRATTTEEGILNFNLSTATADVVIGTNADQGGETTRGIFELVNTGCNFTQVAGSKISIANGVTNASAPSLYIDLDPSEVSLGNGSVIAFGSSDTKAGQSMSIYSSVDLKNVEVDNSSTNDPQLTMSTVSLTLDTLTIDALTTFDANGLDLNLNGDLIANGAFTANQNNTYFLGTNNQQIVGSPTFWNLYKTTSNQLLLNNDIDVDNELGLNAGTFNDGDNTLSVQGSVNMDITTTWGASSDGILMNGNTEQVLTGNGTFGKLSINNSAGISLPQGNEFTISGELQLENGVLDIGKNLLVLDENAIIREENAFSENNMIQTNISFTDAGVKKLFPAIIPADNYDFIFPIGSEGKYTPVEMDIDNVDANGSIRVKGANEMHPTITDDTEPCNELDDVLNVLKYHWVLEASGISGFNADVSMQYYSEDYQLNSTDYNVDDYIAARLLFGSTLWNKYGETSFDELNNLLKFTFSNADDNGISGDYTAGVEDQGGGCEGAIPDEVPMYISKQDGNWTDASTWETYPDPTGTVPSGGPRGAIVIVKDEVTVPTPYIVSYKTIIQSTGTVDVGTTFGHRLGIVEGTGTLRLERGNLPAGVYDDFFSRSGGTIEFTGSDDYDVLSEVNNVRNIIFSGTGERRLPNLDFEVYGEFTIDGSDGNLWVINEHDRDMTLDSNIIFNQGKFDAGLDPSTVTFGGTDQQIISGTGSFTSSNAFRNVIVNNSNGVTLSSPAEIKGTLAFTTGVITTDATNILTINNTSETAVSRVPSTISNYVDGPMRKLIQNGGNFDFPAGDAGRYGPVSIYNTTNGSSAYWIAEYFNTGHTSSSVIGALVDVSTDEYWAIDNPAAGDAAEIELRWDSNSTITPLTTGDINEIVVAEYAGSDWIDKASDNPSGDNYDGTVKTSAAINTDPIYYTLGSTTTILAQAYFTNPDDVCEGVGIPVSFAGVDGTNLSYTLDYDYFDGSTTTSNSVTVDALPYSLPTTDGAGTYELTGFEYNSGGNTGTVNSTVVTANAAPAQPTISAVGEPGSLTFCNGGSVILTSSAGTDYLWSTGATTQNINVTTSGNYTVQVSNATGCYSVASDPKTVTVNPLPSVTVSAVPATICFGETSVLTATGGGTYLWSPDADLDSNTSPNPTFDPSITGTNPTSPTQVTTTFTVTVTNAGCSDTGTVDVVVVRKPETGPQYHIKNDWGN